MTLTGQWVGAGQEGASQDDLAAQMEAAAEQLAAAKREREARRREEAISQVSQPLTSVSSTTVAASAIVRHPERWIANLFQKPHHDQGLDGEAASVFAAMVSHRALPGLIQTWQLCAWGQVEMVLQTYYHNLDNTYNKLQTINEYMDDVEVRFGLRVCARLSSSA